MMIRTNFLNNRAYNQAAREGRWIMYMNVRIPDALGNKLQHIADETGRTKSYYIRKAIEAFIEDREDYLLAVSRLEEKNATYHTLEEVIKHLGLENKAARKSRKRTQKVRKIRTRKNNRFSHK
jgi:RHH-type transcriptional regulator, rel operon repressor / antitoxin RelB